MSAPNKNPFDIKDTGLVKRKTEYDPKTKSYFVSEKIGNIWYRKPASISFEDFWKLEAKKSENDYLRKEPMHFLYWIKKVNVLHYKLILNYSIEYLD